MNAFVRCCLTVAALLGASPRIVEATSFRFPLSPGPYAVGVRTVDQYDPSRTFPAHGGAADMKRPMRTVIWYPALPGGPGKPMAVGDYAAPGRCRHSFRYAAARRE